MGTGLQLQIGAQQRAAGIVGNTCEEISEDVSTFGDALEQHAPNVTGSAMGVMGEVTTLWSESLKVFNSDLQKYAQALAAVDSEVSQTESNQNQSFSDVSSNLAHRMGG